MVDFNKEGTVSTPAIDIVKILLVQKLEYVSDAWEDYNKKAGSGVKISTSLIKSRLFTLYLQLIPYLKRQNSTKKTTKSKIDLKELENNITNGDKSKLWDLTISFIDLIDKLKITKLDTRKEFDESSPEAENLHMT